MQLLFGASMKSFTKQIKTKLPGSRIVIPSDLKEEILHKLHEGHQGIVTCHLCPKESVWWPGISDDINTFSQNCDTCCKDFPVTTQPLIPTKLLKRPWEKVAFDLFELKDTPYIIVVDYFSRYVEILKCDWICENRP